tara:strand:- start:378 stop:620 length:243 start_codon:yes stop_codon:yes gene_type:complete
MMKILLTFLVSSLLLACSTSRPGTARLYAAPITPTCVALVEGYGMYDYRSCGADEIGKAWVKEKRLRQKYEKQVGILNEK